MDFSKILYTYKCVYTYTCIWGWTSGIIILIRQCIIWSFLTIFFSNSNCTLRGEYSKVWLYNLFKKYKMNTMYLSRFCIIRCIYGYFSKGGGGCKFSKKTLRYLSTYHLGEFGIAILHPTKSTKQRRYVSITCHCSLRLQLRMIPIRHMTV